MDEQIKQLVNECLQCKNPTCVKGCPAHNNIPLFISLCKQEKYQEAFDVIKETSTLPSICSLVCPTENQCVGHCIKNKINKAVQVNKIEQYITLKATETLKNVIKNDKKVAIIGSGPASLACCERLALLGYNIDVFEKYDELGGILTYGIPSFVLDKNIVNEKIEYIKKLGVNFYTNKELNKDFKLDDILNKYDAIFIGFGASISKRMGIDNSNLKGVIDANDFLEKVHKNNIDEYKNYKNIFVIGGGNTAIDAALCAKKISDSVTIIYRRSENEMPARKDEIRKCKEENIKFNFLTNPIQYIGKDKLEEIECIKMELVEVENGRAKPVVIANSNFKVKADLVIEAISSAIDPTLTTNLKTHNWGGIIVNENMQTSIEKVFAGGDCVNGPSLVVKAMKDGINAADCINIFIQDNNKNT